MFISHLHLLPFSSTIDKSCQCQLAVTLVGISNQKNCRPTADHELHDLRRRIRSVKTDKAGEPNRLCCDF
ncbi:hypothetical protein AYO47_09925 [Planctomyces sp. SCGC AG-212-M04]|nr:hypothetical protein AYO47_09925 [Planctomyces sp. SCGC AG-212-M04]